jgi:hypothetical protein
MFEALARGYLATAGSFLTPAEKPALAFSGKLITFEIGVRFLTDHLQGDVYFKIHRPGHNLDRCRTQFKLAWRSRRNPCRPCCPNWAEPGAHADRRRKRRARYISYARRRLR